MSCGLGEACGTPGGGTAENVMNPPRFGVGEESGARGGTGAPCAGLPSAPSLRLLRKSEPTGPTSGDVVGDEAFILFVRFQVGVAGKEIDHEKKDHAGDEINAKRMDMAGAFSFDELVR